ncbi:hypothetical protein [uncultured Mycobacterium sp.]|uniref:hypothetical protein n=1 Tax=uncultured Mycobacterium sp. TaxID=171292 RepID=UPI0035CC10E0
MREPLTDVGPATPPPPWCLPDAEPRWEELTDQCGGGTVCTWTRPVSDDVWIAAEDRAVDGRVMRTAPAIFYWEPPRDGVTPSVARGLARALITAADIITSTWLDEE